MPEPDALSEVVPEPEELDARDPAPADGSGGTPVEAPQVAEALGRDAAAVPDQGRERAAVYGVLVVLLIGGMLVLRNNIPYETNTGVHTLIETVATVLAFIVGGLALVRFYSRKQATFLLIGTGYLGAGLLGLNHTLLTSGPLIGIRSVFTPSLFAWTWTSERVFLSLFLFVSLLAWRQEAREGEGEAVNEASVYVTALTLTLINLFFFEWVPLSTAHFPEQAVSRPAEFLPALFFGLAFVGFYLKRGWRHDAFEHWLLVSLLISVLGHAAFMSQSRWPHDAMFDAAHLLKVASHLAILAGLLVSVYVTFTRERLALDALTDSNEALAREIGVRARAELVVEESRARLQAFLDNANDLVQSVTPEGRFVYVNSAWKSVLGYSDDDLAELNLFEIVHPDHQSALRDEFERVVAAEVSRRFNVEYVAEDGRVVILSGSAQAQLGEGGASTIQALLRDVTEQRLAERQLADSRANLGALVESTGDAIWSVDRQHRLITFNSAFGLAIEAQTGHEPEVGRLPEAIFLPEDVEWYEELYARALQGERQVALRSEEVDGHERYFELYANPIEGADGVTGGVFFGKDVTQRTRAREALRVAKEEAEAANRAKSDFLASMSHELRTPLNSIIGFTNILLKNKGGRLEDKDLGFLSRVLTNGKHLLDLINEVLDLAKVEAGRMELIIEDVDLGHLVTETVGQLEGQAKVKEGDVALVADVPDESDPVETDSAKLKQVIINLVGNALKFTHEGSVTVRLDLAPNGRTPVRIAVQDTGIGIPADRLEAIFEAFEQAEVGTSRTYGGTGLGLALSRSICQLMGYDLMVESDYGKGSTFSIVMGERAKIPEREEEPEEDELEEDATPIAAETIPVEVGGAVASEAAVEPAEAAVEVRDEAVPAASRGMRDFEVLVIDDERDSRVLMRHYLEDFGCGVITAKGGAEGIAAAKEQRPDLITLDLMMPGMTGWEVLERLKADPEVRDIPVVIVSIVAGEGGRGRLLGAVDLVTKPFEREDLLRVLWRNLVRKRGGRVLVVDDEPDVRQMLKEYLLAVGLEVVMAGDGKEALEAVRSDAPDAVLLDLMMPVMDGMTFLEQLREDPLHMGLPVIVLTAKDLSGAEQEQLGDMASAVLAKGDAVEDQLRDLLGSIFALSGAEEGGGSTDA